MSEKTERIPVASSRKVPIAPDRWEKHAVLNRYARQNEATVHRNGAHARLKQEKSSTCLPTGWYSPMRTSTLFQFTQLLVSILALADIAKV